MGDIGRLFSSCSCCTKDCDVEDWCFVGRIHTDMFAPFVCDAELCLRAPCGEEARVWEEEFEFVDLDELKDMMKQMVEEYKKKWNKGFHIPVRTDLGVFVVGKDSIKNKS